MRVASSRAPRRASEARARATTTRGSTRKARRTTTRTRDDASTRARWRRRDADGTDDDDARARASSSWTARARERVGAAAIAAAIAAIAAMSTPDAALAARSGGRMGGGSFRAASAMSSPSFRGLGSSGMGSTRGAGLGAPSPRASGAGSGTRTSSFFIGPGLGYGYGMGYGMGYGGGGFFNLVLFAMLALAASNALRNATGRGGFGDGLSAGGDSISVVKIQVGLLGSARALQKDLERIADKADTSSPDGLHFVLSETVLALLRNPEYCVYGYAASKVCRGPEQAEETFNDYSIDERGKFEKETLVNVNARRRAETVGVDPAADTNDYILVTIIAAADGGVKMPDITDANDLKTALKRLGAVRVEALQAVEVLWTPQEDGDVLTQTELLRDYPILVNL